VSVWGAVLIRFFCSLCLFFLILSAYANALYPFHSLQHQKQFQDLIHHFRCVVCQDESLAESNAKIAHELKNKIYTMVRENKSNKEINKYLLNRYGNFVLLKPPFIAETYFLWFMPIMLLFIGVCIVIRSVFFSERQ